MGIPLVGTTYPTVTGESKTDALIRIRDEDFPNMQVWSHYWEPGNGYPTFTESFWNELPDSVEVVPLSVKDRNVGALVANFANIPEPWRGRVWVTIHHEPDQWRSATDPRSDPDPTTWWNLIQDLLNRRDAAVGSWGGWVNVYVCMTEDRFRTDRDFWERNWGSKIRTEPRLDAVVWDTFNIGRSVTRTGAEMFGDCMDWVRDLPHPMKTGFREYGQVTPKDQPTDSAQVVSALTENWQWMKANNADHVVLFLVWYYNHNNTLADPTRVRRPDTRSLLKSVITEAFEANQEDSVEPDPSDPQYQFGYDAGWNTRDVQCVQEISDARDSGLDEGERNVVTAVDDVLEQFRE